MPRIVRALSPRVRAFGRAAPLAAALPLLAACGGGDPGEAPVDGRVTIQAEVANLQLRDARTLTVEQTSTQQWTLAKTGSVNTSTRMVTGSVTATATPMPAHRLTLDAPPINVRNSGNTPATVGNVVVRLQQLQGTAWMLAASNVADATAGDAASVATVIENSVATTIVEGQASGSISVKNGTTGASVVLVPQLSLAPGSVLPLVVSATYDSSVLGLPDGARTRAQVEVEGPEAGSTVLPCHVDVTGITVWRLRQRWADWLVPLRGKGVTA